MIGAIGRQTRGHPVPYWIVGTALVGLAGASAVGEEAAVAFERVMATLAIGCLLVIACNADPAWLGASAIALTPFSGNWDLLGVPIPLDRVLLLLAAAVAITRHLATPHPRDRMLRPVHALLAAAAIVALVSAAWAGSLGDHDTRFALLDRYGLVPFAMFVLAPLIFPGARERAVLLGTLVVTGAYLGLTAVSETFGLDALVWPRYILDPEVGIHADRARGPFLEAAANGLGLFACGAAAAVALATWRRPPARATAALVMVLCAAGLLFTVTRSVWLGSAIAIVVGLVASPRVRRHLVPVSLVVALAVAATFALVPAFADQARERQADERPIWDRQNLNAAGARMIMDRPLIGFGFGAGGREGVEFVRQADDIPVTGVGVEIHNVYLSQAVDLGIPGAILWGVAVISTVGVAAVRRTRPELEPWRILLLAVAVQGVVVQNLVPGSFVFPILVTWTLAGIIAGTPDTRDERVSS